MWSSARHSSTLLTPKSVESIYCRAEVAYALALNKPVLPLILKSCDYPPDLKSRRIQYHQVTETDSLGDVLFVIAQALGEIRVARLENPDLYKPKPALRPPEPLPTHQPEQVSEVYLLAEEAAAANNLFLAESLFQRVIDADPQGYGLAAAERLGEIRLERAGCGLSDSGADGSRSSNAERGAGAVESVCAEVWRRLRSQRDWGTACRSSRDSHSTFAEPTTASGQMESRPQKSARPAATPVRVV